MPSNPSAYDQVLSAIASGELPPGYRLRETELAELFGVSRTPIREAIRKLESEGVVQHKPRVGAVVRSLGQQEIVELYEMRIVLETTATQMASKHASEAEIRTLIQINQDIASHGDDAKMVANLNRRFHACIMRAGRNRFLEASYNALSNTLHLLGKTTLESADRITEVVEQHATIINALTARDAEAAKVAMKTHMEASLDHRLKSLQNDA